MSVTIEAIRGHVDPKFDQITGAAKAQLIADFALYVAYGAHKFESTGINGDALITPVRNLLDRIRQLTEPFGILTESDWARLEGAWKDPREWRGYEIPDHIKNGKTKDPRAIRHRLTELVGR